MEIGVFLFMKNHIDKEQEGYPWGNSDCDSEYCYGSPWPGSQVSSPRIQNNPAKQPMRAIEADVSNPPSPA
jgi:hypothetical protein